VGCGCGKSFSNYATGMRTRSSHVPNQRAPVQQAVSIQSKSLQARSANGVQTQAQAAQSGRRKV
jgi:hypothetical protein